MQAHDPSSSDVAALCRLGPRVKSVVDGLVRSPALICDTDAVIASLVQTQIADVAAVCNYLLRWGWIEQTSNDARRLVVDDSVLLALSHRLRGMLEAQQLFEQAKPETTPIATLPETSEALRSVLGGAADECFQTRDGFHHVTARAQHRIVFMIPFMDATGAVAVSEMLQQCRATERIIITRPDSKGTRYHLKFLSQFEAVGAQVLEYWKDRTGADGPRSETFHAKLVLADRDLIYVGSSNLMASSLDGGLECGVLLEGGCARPFRRIVEAVLQVSQRISV